MLASAYAALHSKLCIQFLSDNFVFTVNLNFTLLFLLMFSMLEKLHTMFICT